MNNLKSVANLDTLWAVPTDIIKDDTDLTSYIVLDALDECSEQQEELLSLIVESDMRLGSKVKWLLTSRNEPIIKERLQRDDICSNTSLEVNPHRVKKAVILYIAFEIANLTFQKGDHAAKFVLFGRVPILVASELDVDLLHP